MKISDYILKDLETLDINQSIEKVKNTFLKNRTTHLPVIENTKLLGCFSESDSVGIDESSKTLNDFRYLFETFFATEEDTFLSLLNLFALNETNTIPVVNSKNEYLGYYDLQDILKLFTDTPFLMEEGISLVIEKDSKNYSISEIVQIIETSNGKLFGLFISRTDKTNTQITLKIGIGNANEIIQSFRRYEYTVVSNFKDDSYLEDLKNRSNYLQKYLNI